MLRRVRRYEKEDYSKVERLSMFRCNFVGELIADSLLSSSFLSKIEMQHDAFPRKRFVYGETYLFPEDKDYIIIWSNWGKPEVSHLYSYQSEKRLLETCKELNVHYCFDMGWNDAYFWFYILIDENGNAFNFDSRDDNCYPLKERAEVIIDHIKRQTHTSDS
jgi:hypothetical protein